MGRVTHTDEPLTPFRVSEGPAGAHYALTVVPSSIGQMRHQASMPASHSLSTPTRKLGAMSIGWGKGKYNKGHSHHRARVGKDVLV